ncbi:hypothetical protein NUW58_g5266 [Xylaria curta]|uniref:Uncharacterized protein n=1 Tax=Xylaria curta TaxID=42375 RepID=A0ACC1P2F3_9PEZI|nr:hypothetical protein NUW58_g5266 [Xylaria curta]
MGFRPSEQDLDWQNEHRDETRVLELIVACVSTAAASIVITILRLYSRRLLHRRLCLEAADWLLLVAWACFTILDVSWAVGTKYGLGRHAVVATNLHAARILALVGEAAYVLAIAFIKFSVLAMYWKHSPMRKFRYCLWGVGVLVGGWAMSGILVAIFQCTSIDYIWGPDSQSFCIDLGLRTLISGIMNVIMNTIIVAILIPLIWKNKRTMKHNKYLALATCAVGTSACIVSIVRLPYSIKIGTSDGAWDATPTFIISVVEITVGMLAVSIPSYRPLYEHFFGGGICRSSSNARAGKYKDTLHMSFYGEDARNDVNVSSPGTHLGCEHGGISVTNHIELVRHARKSGSWVRVTDEDEVELCQLAGRTQTTAS